MITEKQMALAKDLFYRGATNYEIAKQIGVSEFWVRDNFPSNPAMIDLAVKKIMATKTPEKAVQALQELHIETERDFNHLLKNLREICANMTDGAVERSKTFKRFSKMANDLAEVIQIGPDDKPLKAVMVLNTVANASIEPVLKLLALTKDVGNNPAFNPVKNDNDLLPLISVDPMEASKEYQRLLNGD